VLHAHATSRVTRPSRSTARYAVDSTRSENAGRAPLVSRRSRDSARARTAVARPAWVSTSGDRPRRVRASREGGLQLGRREPHGRAVTGADGQQTQPQCQTHQALLRAVVEVTLEATPLVITGFDEPAPGRPELRHLRQCPHPKPFVLEGEVHGATRSSTPQGCHSRPAVDERRQCLAAMTELGHEREPPGRGGWTGEADSSRSRLRRPRTPARGPGRRADGERIRNEPSDDDGAARSTTIPARSAQHDAPRTSSASTPAATALSAADCSSHRRRSTTSPPTNPDSTERA
jgi:hypothetical protein